MKLKQSEVIFDATTHTYQLGGVQLQGITGTLIKRAFPDKYKDIDPEVLAEAARKGHELHEAIQNFDRFGIASDDERVKNYAYLKQGSGLVTVENEYLVSDNEHYASSIDVVLENVTGDVVLVDIKTTYTLDRASTALQLSIYKRWFEQQNDGLKVAHICALWLPNRDHTICELVELSPVSAEVIDALIEADLNDEPFTYTSVPQGYDELEYEYRRYAKMKAEAEAGIEQVKTRLMELMKQENLQTIKSGYYTVSYIPEKVGKRFDSTLFKSENKELYNKYMKDSVTAAQVRFTETKNK